jgi:hypothetical protein
MLSIIYSHYLNIINLLFRSTRSNTSLESHNSGRLLSDNDLYTKVEEKNEQIAHRRMVSERQTKEPWAKQQFTTA